MLNRDSRVVSIVERGRLNGVGRVHERAMGAVDGDPTLIYANASKTCVLALGNLRTQGVHGVRRGNTKTLSAPIQTAGGNIISRSYCPSGRSGRVLLRRMRDALDRTSATEDGGGHSVPVGIQYAAH